MSAREEFDIAGFAPPLSHYADAVRFHNLLFVSGLISVSGSGEVLFPRDATRQAHQVFQNFGLLLDQVGARPSDVLRVTVYLVNVKDRVAINDARKAFFGVTRPASTLIGVSSLALPEAVVEVEAIVGLNGS